MKKMSFVLVLLAVLLGLAAAAQELPPVTEEDWGLKIVVFDTGQADQVLLLTRDGEAAAVDLGRYPAHGLMMARYLRDASENGVGDIDHLEYLFISHYDADHIGGASRLDGKIPVLAAYDQGPSLKRNAISGRSIYGRYVRYVGDKDGDGQQDDDEPDFVRHRAEPGDRFVLGGSPEVEIIVLSVRGDTLRTANDLPLDPSTDKIDENPGSMMLYVGLGEFEYLTMGDATSDDWKHEPDTEEAMIDAGAIPGGADIDVLKVSHHGSDTSSGKAFVESVSPELAIICTDLGQHRLPKLTSLKCLEEAGTIVLVTGRARDEDGAWHQSRSAYDDGFQPEHTFDECGQITILIAADGSRYTVRCSKDAAFVQTFDSVD